MFKGEVQGVYPYASDKYLSRYINEFTFRLNEGKVARHTMERLESLVPAIAGKHIIYKELTA